MERAYDNTKLFAVCILLSCLVPTLGLNCYSCVMGDPEGIENTIMAGVEWNAVDLEPACRGPLDDGRSDMTQITCEDDSTCGMIIISETIFVKRGCVPDTLCREHPSVFVEAHDVWMNTTCCTEDLCNALSSPSPSPSPLVSNTATSVVTNSERTVEPASEERSSGWSPHEALAGWRCVTLFIYLYLYM